MLVAQQVGPPSVLVAQSSGTKSAAPPPPTRPGMLPSEFTTFHSIEDDLVSCLLFDKESLLLHKKSAGLTAERRKVEAKGKR